MSTTVNDLQLDLAYRLGEDSAPDGVEADKRLSFFNQAYRSVIREHYWWFTEETTAFNSVANQESYSSSDGFPSNIRGSSILELRYNGTLYTPVTQSDAFQNISENYANYAQSYFIFDQQLYPIPVFSESGTNNVTVKYYKIPTALTTGTDVIIIPDHFKDVLTSYAFARVCQIDSKRGSAADGFDEYNEILGQMRSEQNNYLFALKNAGNTDLETLYP